MSSAESGQGLIPTVSGFAILLALVLFATQVIFDLFARSAVTSATVTAARSVAGYANSASYVSGPPDAAERVAMEQAQARALSSLGGYARATSLDWTGTTGDEVVVRVRFDRSTGPHSPVGALRLPALDRFARTVRVRVEHVVCRPVAACSVVVKGGT